MQSAARLYRQHPEEDFQRTLVRWLELALPEDAWFTAIDHAKRGLREGARLKRMGVRKGILDVLIFWQGKTVWLECKSAKGYATDEQVDFIERARHAGHHASVVRTLDDVWRALRDAGVPRRAKPN